MYNYGNQNGFSGETKIKQFKIHQNFKAGSAKEKRFGKVFISNTGCIRKTQS